MDESRFGAGQPFGDGALLHADDLGHLGLGKLMPTHIRSQPLCDFHVKSLAFRQALCKPEVMGKVMHKPVGNGLYSP